MTPTEQFVAALKQHDCDPKKNGNGWQSRCPAHDDRRPSLSISEGNDGRALVRCHAGCTVDAVCDCVDFRVADLMNGDSSTASTSTKPRQTGEKQEFRRRRQNNGKSKGKTFDSAEVAIEALESRRGKRSAQWTYHDANGDLVGVIVRWDNAGGKEIRPVARRGDQWIIGGMPEPRPLYCLPDLADANRVYICEGEKAAEAARSIGLTSTTSAHGSQSADKTDWSLLAGKECVILPDNDEAGRKYSDDVVAILAKLTPPAVVKVLELPDMPEHGDMVDWVEVHDAVETETLWQLVDSMAEQTGVIRPERRAASIEKFQPFPTDALPEPIRSLVVEGANAIGCDPTMIVLPLIAGLASAIGATRRIRLKEGWCEPAVLWTAIVADSGSHKSPAQELALRSLRQLQSFRLEEYPELQESHERDLLLYDVDLKKWKSKGRDMNEPPPEKPDEPSVARYLVNDITLEALSEQLSKNPRGLLCDCDELSGWFGGFDQYRSGKGADVSRWLSMHRAESLLVDRKTGPIKNLFIKHAAVSVTGGVQPMTLRRVLAEKHFENGLAARILLAAPPKRRKVWKTECVSADVLRRVEKIFTRLLALDFGTDINDSPAPIDLPLTAEAQEVWVEFYDEHAQLQFEATGNIASALAKIEAAAPRLALIVHLARCAVDDPSVESLDAVDATSMRSGITIAQWFIYEVRRVYAILRETDADHNQRRLIEWIERKGGSVTAREVQQGHRQYRTIDDAEAALDDLKNAGCGDWKSVPATSKGGRPSRRFHLYGASTVYETPVIQAESVGFVDVDSVDNPETQDDDDWGEM